MGYRIMANKERHFKKYYERKKIFLGIWLTSIGALPVTADDDLCRIVQESFNAGWNARKDVEYHQSHSGSVYGEN